MRRSLCLTVLALAAAMPATAQQFLPSNFAGWQAVAAPAKRTQPPAATTQDAPLWPSWHMLSSERKTYQRDGQTITVGLYQLADPSYAYSAYSFLRPVPVTDFHPTPHSSVGADRAMMLVGNFLIDVTGGNLAPSAQDLVGLAAAVQPHASRMPYPTLWQYLPTGRFLPHSDRYALDPGVLAAALDQSRQEVKSASSFTWPGSDWLGFDDEVEAEVAQYDLGGRAVTMVLASYPTQQLAAEHAENFSKWYRVNPENATPSPGAAGNRPTVFVKRYASLVGLVAGPVDGAEAQKLLSQVRYQTVVTWNEPAFKLKDLTMPEYIVGIILGTSTILIITLVSGIALGIIRIGVKHYLPGVILDRTRSHEVLQLGLSSKPINSSDFYGS